MVEVVLVVVLLLLGVLAAALRPIYGVLPVKELKRRADKNDQVAASLYQVSRHGVTADVILTSISVVSGAILALIYVNTQPDFLAFLLILITFGLLQFALPKQQFSWQRKLALQASPYLAAILVKTNPLVAKLSNIIKKNRPVTIKTGVYEKEDLIELLANQKASAHNRISEMEISLAQHALIFGDKQVLDHMVPRRVVKFVNEDEPVGPILLSELHDTGFSRFPVINDEEKIVGTLYIKDMIDKSTVGAVSSIMSRDVFYISDTANLEEALAAFLRTKHHLFIVVNSFEEVVGIITIEDILEQLVGRKIVDEFDKYDDMRAVAAKAANKEHRKHNKH